MRQRLYQSIRLLGQLGSVVLILSMLSACGQTSQPSSGLSPMRSALPTNVTELSIMLPSFMEESPDESSPVILKLQELTGTKLRFEFVPNSSYSEQLNIAFASRSLADITVIPDMNPGFINAVRSGVFWDIGPYLKDYPNLSQANPAVLHNSSIDGRTFGIYRTRALGRMGVTVRKDWLDHLGLEAPETIDEFYEMLKAFKTMDPNRNGVDDTYGMVVTRYSGPWDIMQVWFGVPNGWGESESGELIPAHQTPQYMDALRFFRKLVEEGLVNRDFAVMDPSKWFEPVVNGEAGVIVDVSDWAARIEAKIQRLEEQDQVMDVFGAPAGPYGRRDMPTLGFSGVLAISKSRIKTEEDLRRVLEFLDRTNDSDVQNLLAYGIEGRHYERKGDYIVPSEDLQLMVEVQNMNQLLMFIPENRTLEIEPTPLRQKTAGLQKENEEIIVINPAAPLISNVYAEKGEQLDEMISDARTMYILGQLDEPGLQAKFEEWNLSGGADYVKEINTLYQQMKHAH